MWNWSMLFQFSVAVKYFISRLPPGEELPRCSGETALPVHDTINKLEYIGLVITLL